MSIIPVTIKNKFTLFKGDEPATFIELLEFVEVGFPIVSQKNLYEVGDVAYFIEPDYCLPDTPIFDSYIRPFGETSKSKLGKNNRIRAIQFGFHKGNGISVFSYGILLSKEMIEESIGEFKLEELVEKLGIYKVEPREDGLGYFPDLMYKTGEMNVNYLWNHLQYPIKLIGTIKENGESLSVFYKNGETGICGRTVQLPDLIPNNDGVMVENSTKHYQAGLPILKKLINYCEECKVNLVIRGEVIDVPLTKNTKETVLRVFNIDEYDTYTTKVEHGQFKIICEKLGLTTVEELFSQEFNSKEEIVSVCEDIFKTRKIEGIVLKTPDNRLSFKYMSLTYDSKKK